MNNECCCKKESATKQKMSSFECCGKEIEITPEMMQEMMPHCIKTILPKLPKEKQAEFVLEIIHLLIQKTCEKMPEVDKKDFIAKVNKIINK